MALQGAQALVRGARLVTRRRSHPDPRSMLAVNERAAAACSAHRLPPLMPPLCAWPCSPTLCKSSWCQRLPPRPPCSSATPRMAASVVGGRTLPHSCWIKPAARLACKSATPCQLLTGSHHPIAVQGWREHVRSVATTSSCPGRLSRMRSEAAESAGMFRHQRTSCSCIPRACQHRVNSPHSVFPSTAYCTL